MPEGQVNVKSSLGCSAINVLEPMLHPDSNKNMRVILKSEDDSMTIAK